MTDGRPSGMSADPGTVCARPAPVEEGFVATGGGETRCAPGVCADPAGGAAASGTGATLFCIPPAAPVAADAAEDVDAVPTMVPPGAMPSTETTPAAKFA